MNDAEFYALLEQLTEYLRSEKAFVSDPARELEFNEAVKTAYELFPEAHISIENDPLQMGAMILCIDDFDIDVSGTDNIQLFHKMVHKADNFEFHSIEDGNVRLSAVYEGVLIRI